MQSEGKSMGGGVNGASKEEQNTKAESERVRERAMRKRGYLCWCESELVDQNKWQ